MSDSPIDDKNPDIDAVIRKIQKLLIRTKGDRGATDEESDTAMKIVQGLMAKYNLDMATVDAAGSSHEDTGAVRVDEKSTARARFKWQRELMRYVSEANFCLHIIRSEYKYDEDNRIVWGSDGRKVKHAVHRIIGRKANVITAQLMFDYLCRTIEDSVPVVDKRTDRFSKAASSWKEGCAEKLCERLAKRRQDLMAEHDARVKEQEAAFQEHARKKAAEAKAKQLGPRPPTADETAEVLKAGARYGVGMKSEAPSEEPERPETNSNDAWVPGANAEPMEEAEEAPAPVTTLVLASVYDEREQDLNQDLQYGLEPGTTSRNKAAREKRLRKYEEEAEARRLAEELEDANTNFEAESEGIQTPAPVETDRQRERREKREEKEYEQDRKRWARENDREHRKAMKEHARRDHGAFRAGMKTGEKIGLDPQVKARADAKRLKGE